MKTRNGFVSNSSSSSFILALPGRPTSAKQMHEWMFPDGPITICPYDFVGALSSERAADIAYEDLKDATALTRDEIVDELDSGSFCAPAPKGIKFPKYPDYYTRKGLTDAEEDALYEKYGKETRAVAEKLADHLICESPKAFFFRVSYSDGNGSVGTNMEHGDVFRNLVHRRTSHH